MSTPPVQPPHGNPPIIPNYEGQRLCPFCGGAAARPVSFTWWGGLIGPKLFSLVKCGSCRKSYNGKTGKSADTAILIYILVSCGISILILIVAFASGLFTVFNKL